MSDQLRKSLLATPVSLVVQTPPRMRLIRPRAAA
jgi:hypothetical protein